MNSCNNCEEPGDLGTTCRQCGRGLIVKPPPDKSTVVRLIPAAIVQEVRAKLGGGYLRPRGARIHNGRRYFQDLPREYAERYSLYNTYWNNRGRQYMDYVGMEGAKVRLRYNQRENI